MTMLWSHTSHHCYLFPHVQIRKVTFKGLLADSSTILNNQSPTIEKKAKTISSFNDGSCYRIVPIKAGGRILEFIYSGKQVQTKKGLKVGTATTHYFDSAEEFKIKQKQTKAFIRSRVEVISSSDFRPQAINMPSFPSGTVLLRRGASCHFHVCLHHRQRIHGI
ncbi:hypothetical protein EJ110_NYTH23738 [Nymphaea thermarum]|nr:hypothetical protein EJ110_NYTH23738 [Nymphaea thermarum]